MSKRPKQTVAKDRVGEGSPVDVMPVGSSGSNKNVDPRVRSLLLFVQQVAQGRAELLTQLRAACERGDDSQVVQLARRLTGLSESMLRPVTTPPIGPADVTYAAGCGSRHY